MMMQECCLGTGLESTLVVLLLWPGLEVLQFCNSITKLKKRLTLVSVGFSLEFLPQVGLAPGR